MKTLLIAIVWTGLLASPCFAQLSEPNDRRLVADAVLTRGELHQWERHVRGFRREHNFAFSSGVTSGVWFVKHLGCISEKR